MTSLRSAISARSAEISGGVVLRGSLIVGACLIGGQILGFLRHVTIAYLLGTGPPADAIAVAFAPVDLWWAVASTAVIFGYGPLMAAREGGPAFSELARPLLVASVIAAAACAMLAGPVVRATAPGLPAETAALAARLLRVTSLAIPAVSASALFTALLFSRRKFAFAAFRQGVMNICTVASALLLHARLGVLGFAIGYAGGAWLQLGGVWAISRPMLAPESTRPERTRLRSLLGAPLGVLFYSAMIGLTPVVTRALASTFGSGATAAFDYCLRIVGVPLALLVTPLSSSLLAEIAPFRLADNLEGPRAAIRKAAGLTALASIVVVGLLLWVGPRIVAILFERGRFGAGSTETVSAMLSGFCPALAAWGVLDVVSRSLFALGKPRIPILAAAVALGVTGVLSMAVPISSIRWVGLPAAVGFLSGAAVVTSYLWRPRPTRGRLAC